MLRILQERQRNIEIVLEHRRERGELRIEIGEAVGGAVATGDDCIGRCAVGRACIPGRTGRPLYVLAQIELIPGGQIGQIGYHIRDLKQQRDVGCPDLIGENLNWGFVDNRNLVIQRIDQIRGEWIVCLDLLNDRADQIVNEFAQIEIERAEPISRISRSVRAKGERIALRRIPCSAECRRDARASRAEVQADIHRELGRCRR